MLWPHKGRCAGCRFKGGAPCCPRCTWPEAPNRGASMKFCPKVKAEEEKKKQG